MGRKNEEKNELTVVLPQIGNIDRFTKSNMLIASKYESSIMSERLLLIALSQLQHTYKDNEGDLVCKMTSPQLKAIMQVKTTGGMWYKSIREGAEMISGLKVGYSNDANSSFEFVTLIRKCNFRDGVLTVVFNKDAEMYLVGMKKQYTNLKLSTTMKMRSNYSLRLYQLCKSYAYKGQFTMLISELKFVIGVLDINDAKAMRALGTINPDYDKAAAAVDIKKYSTWKHFRADLLLPAINEINTYTDIDVSFKPVCSHGNKTIDSVCFVVRTKEEIPEITRDNVSEILDLLTDLNLFPSEASMFIREAEGNQELVIEKCRLCLEAMRETRIDDPVNWITNEIKKDVKGWSRAAQNTAKEISTQNDNIYIDPKTNEEIDISELPKTLRDFAVKNYKKKSNLKSKKEIIVNDEPIDELLDLMHGDFKAAEIRMFLDKANGDAERVRKAYEYFLSYPRKIDNTIGFIITAIEQNFEGSRSKAPAKKETVKPKYRNYDEREYSDEDFEEMEEKLMNRDKEETDTEF